jgi:hypothetical protein
LDSTPLHAFVEHEKVRQLVEAALPALAEQDDYMKELLLVLPRLVFYLPELALPRLYRASRSGGYAVLALMDGCAGLAAQRSGPELVRALAEAIEKARACLGQDI